MMFFFIIPIMTKCYMAQDTECPIIFGQERFEVKQIFRGNLEQFYV